MQESPDYYQMTDFEAKFNKDGLIPVIAREAATGEVLMLAWMNREALDKTLTSGEAWYWSRSRQELWHKGATSGHRQIVKNIAIDCDQDAILLSVDQIGGKACHTGRKSCFYRTIPMGRPLKEIRNLILKD